jgi:hypothetical protein
MIQRLVRAIRSLFAEKGYSFFQTGDWNLNLIGVRSKSNEPGAFDDLLICIYKVEGVWRAHLWPITTDPGTHYLKKPINVQGTAILAPGQYRGAYVVGKHHGYPALVQHGAPVRVWRDKNKDKVLDWGEGSQGISGWYGINIHRAKPEGITDSPDYHSAGCQVFALKEEHDALMDLAELAAKRYGNKFTYTLIEAADL